MSARAPTHTTATARLIVTQYYARAGIRRATAAAASAAAAAALVGAAVALNAAVAAIAPLWSPRLPGWPFSHRSADNCDIVGGPGREVVLAAAWEAEGGHSSDRGEPREDSESDFDEDYDLHLVA